MSKSLETGEEAVVSKQARLKKALKRWEYWVGGIGVALTVAIVVMVVLYWQRLEEIGHYGYLGAFLISVFGGATIVVPIPMTPTVFALGAVMKPAFAPPIWVRYLLVLLPVSVRQWERWLYI